MAQINFAKSEVQCKVVYYGPALSGKTANLRSIHARTPENVRGNLTTIATDSQRTLFFDFLPLDIGVVAGIRTKIHLYATVRRIHFFLVDPQQATRRIEGVEAPPGSPIGH